MKKFLIIFFLFLFYNNVKAQGCLNADVMILIDWSGSENGNEQQLALAATLFVSELPINELELRVGVLAFSNCITNVVNLTGDKEKLLEGIATLALTEASGGTYLKPSILYAGYLLNNQRQVPKIIIIISDGEIYDLEESIVEIEYFKSIIPLSIRAVQVGKGTEGYDQDINNYKVNLQNLILLTGNYNYVEFSLPEEIVKTLKKLSFCN